MNETDNRADDGVEIERIGRKQRRHIYLSRELDAVTDQLLPNYRQFSPWAEQMLWSALVEEFGADAVLEAVERAQSEIDDDSKLPKDDRDHISLQTA